MAGQVVERPRSATVCVTPTVPAEQFTVAVFTPVAPVPLCCTSLISLESVPVVATSYRSVLPLGAVQVAEAVQQAAL